MFESHKVKEYRIFGGPGCGKTTELTRLIKDTVARFGPDSVIVTSLTKAAARELAGRGLPLAEERVGTLHALAFRGLGSPELIETPKRIAAWNEWVARHGSPHYVISRPKVNRRSLDDLYPDPEESGDVHSVVGGQGSKLLALCNLHRARMDPEELWPRDQRDFFARWVEFKAETGSVDFTDLLELALERLPEPPIPCRTIFADEVQDFARLPLALIRQWGSTVENIVIAGDDDQCLYRFAGATPEAFLDPPIPQERIKVLGRSWRLPAAVKAFADKILTRLSRRQEKSVRADREGGTVAPLGGHYLAPFSAVTLAEASAAQNRRVMITASCAYMLEPTIRELRHRGDLFHNPWRPENEQWNSVRGGVDRLRKFLLPSFDAYGAEARMWRWGEIWPWLELLDAKMTGLAPGAKDFCKPENLKQMNLSDVEVTRQDLAQTLGIEMPPLDLRWYFDHVLPSRASVIRHAVRVAERHGLKELLRAPRIMIGTVHSFKGGEADDVIVYPDVSPAARHEAVRSVGGRDSVLRTFYVACTRAKDRLYFTHSTYGPGGTWTELM